MRDEIAALGVAEEVISSAIERDQLDVKGGGLALETRRPGIIPRSQDEARRD